MEWFESTTILGSLAVPRWTQNKEVCRNSRHGAILDDLHKQLDLSVTPGAYIHAL